VATGKEINLAMSVLSVYLPGETEDKSENLHQFKEKYVQDSNQMSLGYMYRALPVIEAYWILLQ
jgi:hypothetical protein